MTRFGIHALVWGADGTPEGIDRMATNSAEVGYDLVEVVIFDPAIVRSADLARSMGRAGLDVVTGMALNPTADISSPDKDIARRGEALISDAILATRDMGSQLLGGVTHSAMHRYAAPATDGTHQRLLEAYGRLARRASAAGVRLGIEAVNRYESNVVNTVDDAAAIVAAVGSPALFAHVDTFHMNIEEHDMADAILRNIDAIGHVHIGESHRGYLGTGSVDFAPVFRALLRGGYDGPIVFEAFSPAVLDAPAVNGLAAWTTHWSDSRDLATRALAFMRQNWSTAQVITRNRGPLPRPELQGSR